MTNKKEKKITLPSHSNKSLHVFLWLGLASFVGFAAWAYIAKLDVFSVALGEVVPASRVKQIQHLEGGIVGEILVAEGQKVKKDQSLIVLQPTRNQADVDELTLKISALKTDLVRLESEATLKQQLDFQQNWITMHSDLVDKSKELFRVRTERLIAEKQVQKELVIQRQQNLKEVAARLSKSNSLLVYIKEQIAISNKLLAQNLSNRMKHIQLLSQAAEIKGDIEIFTATQGRVTAAIGEAKAKLVGIDAGFVEQARTEKDKTSRALKELSERLIRFRDSLSRTTLRSPVNGVVKTIYVATQGGVIKPGSTVLEIVPSGDKLVIEARLAVGDIGHVRVGNVAQIQLATPDAQSFDKLIGNVTYVGADSVVNKDGVAFYKIRIETDQAFFKRSNEKYPLFPGMRVQNNIQTGTRTILDYILSPFIKSAASALHER